MNPLAFCGAVRAFWLFLAAPLWWVACCYFSWAVSGGMYAAYQRQANTHTSTQTSDRAVVIKHCVDNYPWSSRSVSIHVSARYGRNREFCFCSYLNNLLIRFFSHSLIRFALSFSFSLCVCFLVCASLSPTFRIEYRWQNSCFSLNLFRLFAICGRVRRAVSLKYL